jgi:hypothetical protein
LLRLAAAAGFEVFLTVDQSIPYQQSIAGLPMALIIVTAKSNRLKDLLPLAAAVMNAIGSAPVGQVTYVRD